MARVTIDDGMTEQPRSSYAQDEATHQEKATHQEEATHQEQDAAIKTHAEKSSFEPSRAGSRIGRYVVLDDLGCGGMGEVYAGRDTELGRLVALKFIAPAMLGVPSSVQKFIREAKSASAINHPNIVTIHEVMQVESTLAIVMELVDGTPLRKLCAAPLPIHQVVAFAEQIAQALAAAHACGIVHRDVKPENIMVRRDGYIKLLDFGLAHRLTSDQQSSRSGLSNGTWRYMSPEQLCGKAVSAQSDIFSFGLVLYEMCTGSHPFAAESPFETLHAIGALPAARPALLNPFVPEKLELLVLAMLAKNADERPSAAEVALQLQQFHRRDTPDLAATARLPSARDPKKIWRVRFAPKSLTWAAMAAVVLALVLLLPKVQSHLGRTVGSVGSSSIKSLAVLPPEDMAHDSSAEDLANGITDQITTTLLQTNSMRVIPRSSVMHYKGTARPLVEIARALQADAIIQGSISRQGRKLRITEKLIDARAERQLWVHSYEHDQQDILASKGRIAGEIIRDVSAILGLPVSTYTANNPAPNPLAFEDYLTGRSYWNRRTPATLGSAAAFFERAIARDDRYAAAYAGLADTYSIMGEFEMLAPEEAHRRAKLAAVKALQIDENLAEAHASLGYAKATYDRDWTGAEQELQRALQLSPSYGTAHRWYGACLSTMGRHAEALAELRRAQQLDPQDQAISIDLGWSLYLARDYGRAVTQLKSAVAMSPQQPFAHYRLGFALIQAGQPLQALTEFRRSVDLSKGRARYLAGIGFGYSMASQDSKARQTIATLLEMRAKHRPVPASSVAIVYAGMADKDQALSWLEKAYEERDDDVYALNVDPLFDSIRPDPRSRNLLGRLGFTP